MKIQICDRERCLTLLFPTGLLLCGPLLKWGLRVGRRYSAAVPEIPPAAVDALCEELRRIKKTRGPWVLAEVEAVDGERVRVLL